MAKTITIPQKGIVKGIVIRPRYSNFTLKTPLFSERSFIKHPKNCYTSFSKLLKKTPKLLKKTLFSPFSTPRPTPYPYLAPGSL